MRALLVALAAVLFVAGPPAVAKDKEKLVVTPGEKANGVEVLTCAPRGKAFLHVPDGLDAAKKPGLLVTLHGHGGSPDGYIWRDFAARRKWGVVSIQGRTQMAANSFSWDPADADYIAAVAKWCVQNRGFDPAQVVVFGHSAGGTMSLAAYAADPSVFAGILTCAAPATPDKRHETTRVCVFLGTADPNFSNAKEVQNRMKKDAGRLSLAVMDGAEHNDTPCATYIDLACDWVLAKNALGHEFHVPKKPPEAPAAGLRHVLFRWKGAAGATDVKRSKEAAKAAADDLLKRLRAGKANFGQEAQAGSDDAESQPLGGAISIERLAEFGGAVAAIKDAAPGADRWSGPFESPAGWHVVERQSP
jgi:poly(3-hydroxybutyrate) depolymerase